MHYSHHMLHYVQAGVHMWISYNSVVSSSHNIFVLCGRYGMFVLWNLLQLQNLGIQLEQPRWSFPHPYIYGLCTEHASYSIFTWIVVVCTSFVACVYTQECCWASSCYCACWLAFTHPISSVHVYVWCYRVWCVIIAERISARQLLRVVFSRYAYVRRQFVTLRNVTYSPECNFHHS